MTSMEQQKPAASDRQPTVASPFFRPTTPHVVVARRTTGGFRQIQPMEQEDVIVENKSGIIGCTANMMTCIVGSGIVGIPYAVKQAGFGAGVCLIVFSSLITEKSLRLLVSTAKHIHVPTYETAAEAAFGITGFRFILVNMFIMAYGAMVTYLMICKSSFSYLFQVDPDDEATRQLVLFAVSLTIMLPLSTLRDMADLDKTSRLAVLIDTILVGLVACTAPWSENLQRIGGWWTLLKTDTIHYDTIFVGLGVLSFAFECQESAFLVAGSLERPTLKRWSKVTAGALSICACLAMTCGVTGYVGYLDDTKGNILDNLDPKSWSSTFAQAMLGTTMFATFPLASFVARHVCVVLLFKGRHAHEGDDTLILNRPDRRILLTVALYLFAIVPATLFQDLGAVLALAGVIGGSCLAYIGPGMLYLGVHGGRFLELVQDSWLVSGKGGNKDGAFSNGSNHRQTTFAVETTPLVASQEEAANMVRQAETQREQVGIVPTVVWYLTGMPIWCKIAALGKKGLTRHVHDLTSKSPHPIRIGEVQYSLVAVLESGQVDADPKESSVVSSPGFKHQSSAPIQGKNAVLPIIDQEIGKALLEQQGWQKQQKELPLEPDPQEEPPAWKDFFVAIFYIFFGVIALFAGLVSLYADTPTPDMAH